MEAMLTMTTAASPMDMATTSEKATMIFVEMRKSFSFTSRSLNGAGHSRRPHRILFRNHEWYDSAKKRLGWPGKSKSFHHHSLLLT